MFTPTSAGYNIIMRTGKGRGISREIDGGQETFQGEKEFHCHPVCHCKNVIRPPDEPLRLRHPPPDPSFGWLRLRGGKRSPDSEGPLRATVSRVRLQREKGRGQEEDLGEMGGRAVSSRDRTQKGLYDLCK